MLVFEERGKPENSEKNLSEQGREPTANSTHIWRRRRELTGSHWWEASALTTAPPLLREFGHEEARIHFLILDIATVVPSSGRRT